ncbi:hypothetical protein [Streptomyces sp. NPDC059466]
MAVHFRGDVRQTSDDLGGHGPIREVPEPIRRSVPLCSKIRLPK